MCHKKHFLAVLLCSVFGDAVAAAKVSRQNRPALSGDKFCYMVLVSAATGAVAKWSALGPGSGIIGRTFHRRCGHSICTCNSQVHGGSLPCKWLRSGTAGRMPVADATHAAGMRAEK